MNSILTLTTHNKYKQLIDDGLIMVPDNTLNNTIIDIWNAYRENFNKKIMVNLINKLKEIIPGEIDKNELLSYVIELD